MGTRGTSPKGVQRLSWSWLPPAFLAEAVSPSATTFRISGGKTLSPEGPKALCLFWPIVPHTDSYGLQALYGIVQAAQNGDRLYVDTTNCCNLMLTRRGKRTELWGTHKVGVMDYIFPLPQNQLEPTPEEGGDQDSASHQSRRMP